MSNKLFLYQLDLTGTNFPSWEAIPDEAWQEILTKYFFKVADSFAFATVLQTSDLFVDKLSYFRSWQLEEVGLIEVDNDIICKFQLNADCQQRLLEFEFAVHQSDANRIDSYYEFDQLYFFAEDRLIGFYINHESWIEFVTPGAQETYLIQNLPPHLHEHIVDSTVFTAAIKSRMNRNS